MDTKNIRFAHLRTKTQYSQLNSVLKINSIADYAKTEQSFAIGMMDDMGISGAFKFCKAISGCQTKPLIGLNVLILDDDVDVKKNEERAMSIGVLAMNEAGYKNIISIIHRSQFNYGKSSEDARYIKTKDLQELNEGLICLSGGYNGLVSSYFRYHSKSKAKDYCRILQQSFGDRFYIELTRHGRSGEKELEDFLIDTSYEFNIPLVATNDTHFFLKKNFDAYDTVSCVKDNKFVNQGPEDRWKLNKEYYLKSENEMVELFSDIPESVENTVMIAKRCSFIIKENKPMLPSFTGSQNEQEEKKVFLEFTKDGLVKRLEESNITDKVKIKEYQDRLEFETSVIIKMNFVGYFLIVCDFVRWAKLKNIPVGPGRGSGAGSIVAWCLDITNVDPIKYGLIFERFLNPERVSMPDFDIDFCQTRRHELFEYVTKKYGRDRVGSIITFGKLQAKAALKDIGRVLQMPYKQIDEICKLIPFNPTEPVTLSNAIQMDDRLKKEVMKDSDVQNLIEITLEVEGLNRHTSTHAAGIVINSAPLTEIVPVHKDNDTDLAIVGFDMKDCENIGLVKFDFLGLKTLSVINETVRIIKKRSGEVIDINKIDEHDSKTLKLLQSSKTKGIFQLEATVPREAMQRISVNGILDISAITSLNRPGPMAFIPDYIKRKNGHEVVKYPHPSAEAILKETYGIMIYQEQVMKMAQIIAGYSMGDADLLRRAMGKKIKEEMDKQEDIFSRGAKKNNIPKSKAKEIFKAIEKFAGYGFNKSHSVAYSIISYQTAYLKANYTIDFFTAMANLDLTRTDKIVEIVNDARCYNITVVVPNINTSEENFNVNEKSEIVYGMGALKSVSTTSVHKIVEERKKNGQFKDIFDFIKRCGSYINKRQLESLIKAGSFDEMLQNRKTLLNNIEEIVKYGSNARKLLQDQQHTLFKSEDSEFLTQSPSLKEPENSNMSALDFITHEFDSFGFYLNKNPINEYTAELKKYNILQISEVTDSSETTSQVVLIAGVVTKIKQRSGKKGRFAFLTIIDMSGIFELAVFNDYIITDKRELLQEGQTLIVGALKRVDKEIGLRLNVIDLFDIKDAFSNNGEKIELFLKKQKTKTKKTSYYNNKANAKHNEVPDIINGVSKNSTNVIDNPNSSDITQLSTSLQNKQQESKLRDQLTDNATETLKQSQITEIDCKPVTKNYKIYNKKYCTCVAQCAQILFQVAEFAKKELQNTDPDCLVKILILNVSGKKINTKIPVSQLTITAIEINFNVQIY
ncbi:MAG: DNA polymerase III subunit alpha [Alphaproteobacteria bacterium]|nr:DNA polymerase III subunit alpha [Rickettsiales bacterium]